MTALNNCVQSNVPSSGGWCNCRDLITGVEHFGPAAAVCSQRAGATQADVNERNGGLLPQCPRVACCNPVSTSALPLRIIHARHIISNYHFNPQPKACCVSVCVLNILSQEIKTLPINLCMYTHTVLMGSDEIWIIHAGRDMLGNQREIKMHPFYFLNAHYCSFMVHVVSKKNMLFLSLIFSASEMVLLNLFFFSIKIYENYSV